MALYVGLNETDITPPLGVGLCGYAYRPQGAVAVHDPLYAQAIVFDNGVARLVLLGMDLIALDFNMVDRVRRELSHQLIIPESNVMLNAIHTHAGPSTRTYHAMPAPDSAYLDILERKLIGCARQAADHLQPATLRHATAPAQLGINRRENVNGATRLGNNPGGPVDSKVRCVIIADSRGDPLALLYSTACHPVTLGGDNLKISADYPGAARRFLRKKFPDDSVFAFLQGCCGNINPWRRGTFAEVEANGELLAAAVLDAYSNSRPLKIDPLEAEAVTVDIPVFPPLSPKEAETQLEEAEQELNTARKSNADAGRILYLEGMRDFAVTMKWISEKAEGGIKARSKYDPLATLLRTRPREEEKLALSLDEVERVIHDSLPETAKIDRTWWGNTRASTHALRWLDAGWKVDEVDLQAGHVTFLRIGRETAESDSSPTVPFSTQRFKIGDLQIIGMPGEVFVQYGLDFEQQAARPVLALGYTNGCHNYVPTAADYPLGGYEVEMAYRFYGEPMYKPEVENIIRGAAYRLLGIENPDYTPYGS